MQKITGHHPNTCPWRVMYSPIVREVLMALEHEEHGNLAVALGGEPPHLLIEAIAEFKRSLRAVRNDDAKIAEEKRKRDAATRGRR